MTVDTDYDLPTLLGTYRRDGSLIREKARVLVEDWMDRIYPRMQDPETPTSTLLSIGESLIKLGDLGPKQGAGVGGGAGGFSIQIVIPQANGEGPITISGSVPGTDITGAPPEILEIRDLGGGLPDRPSFIPIPDFNLNSDLSGGLPPGMDPRAAVPLPPRPLMSSTQQPTHSLAPMSAFAKAVMSPPGAK